MKISKKSFLSLIAMFILIANAQLAYAFCDSNCEGTCHTNSGRGLCSLTSQTCYCLTNPPEIVGTKCLGTNEFCYLPNGCCPNGPSDPGGGEHCSPNALCSDPVTEPIDPIVEPVTADPVDPIAAPAIVEPVAVPADPIIAP